MILLQDILYKVAIKSVSGLTNLPVKNLQIDSRKIEPDGCFIALRGVEVDGHNYIDAAIDRGATSIICDEMPATPKVGVTYVQCHDTAQAAGMIAHSFYGEPSLAIELIGVTGTNGKTTIATLLHKLYMSLGHKSGLISTVHNQIGNEIFPSTHTTPDPISLNAMLRMMVDQGCTHAFMEVSSHAIHQHRISGLHFKGAIFSNITHDHLDYHKTFDEYIRVKKMFFDDLPASAFAISNVDDRNGSIMLQNSKAKKFYYGLKTICDFKGRIIDNAIDGLLMAINEQEVHFRLIGEFNAYNILAVFAAAVCNGEDRMEVLVALSNLTGAEGRFDCMLTNKEKIIGIIDYAHTPDALLNVLSTVKKLQKGGESIITVVGCGGDRDRSKRKLMGKAAAEFSTKAIFTSDNPRTEDPDLILRDMYDGLDDDLKRKVIMIVDRREAIKTAVMMAKAEDIILVAGKGHEKYQDIKGVKIPFDDKVVLNEAFTEQDK